MPLTDVACKNAKPREKPYKLSDGGGLYLLIQPGGAKKPSGPKWWRLKYRFDGKEQSLSLGVYPDVGLKTARERRDEARKLLAEGINPGDHRKAVKVAKTISRGNTFEVVTQEWLENRQVIWSPSYRDKIFRRLEKDCFPWVGKRPIADITAQELLAVLRRVEKRGVRETAHRELQYCGQVFRYAIVTGRAKYDVSRDLQGALLPIVKGHHAAITDPVEFGAFLKVCRDYQGGHVVRCALQLAPLVLLRPGELRYAEWAEIDFENAQWNIPAKRMKMKTQGAHIVPLSRQAIAILKELKPLTGRGQYIFPSIRTHQRPMSDNTVNAALRRLGYDKDTMTGHGFRATARTIMDEVLGIRPDFIEHQLHHAVKDPNGRAYNRTSHLPERRDMMQKWADYLDGLAKSGEG